MSRLLNSLSFVLAFLVAASCGSGQVSENHTVEHLEVSELGPFEPVRSPDLQQVEQQIVEQTNAFRKEEGREKVEVNPTLEETAAKFAQYMAKTDKYGHRADGRSPSQRASAQGYEFCMVSENIAYQFKTKGFKTENLAQGFVEGWKNSPGHRENMLEPDVTETGVAVAQSETTGVFYGVQLFGRPQSQKIEFRLANPTKMDLDYQIADQKYSLPSGYTRKHTLCRPSKLRWQPTPDSETEQLRAIEPADGDEFKVQMEDGKVLIEAMRSGGE